LIAGNQPGIHQQFIVVFWFQMTQQRIAAAGA